MLRKPYQDRNILSDAELEGRIVVMGPFGGGGYHPNTSILYFLINSHDKQRFYNAIKGQSYEKAPIFGLRRKGRLGTIDAFWQESMSQLLAGAIQFAALPNQLILTHMAVRTNWRKLGINSRLIDLLKQRYPGRQIVYDSPTKMGQGFIDSYER
jgi:hypothetical protein